MNKFGHIMVDIETMGDQSYSAILSIGAVEFNLQTGETNRKFYKAISLESSINAGLIMSPSTVLWWLNQSSDAREDLLKNNRDSTTLVLALQEFKEFVDECGNDSKMWGNSARFDLGLLQNAYNKINLPIPWNFHNEQCVRTLLERYPEVKKTILFHGTKHNPINDCLYQIEYSTKIIEKLKK